MQGVTVNVECAECGKPIVAYTPEYFLMSTMIIYKGECLFCHTKVTAIYKTEFYKKGGDTNAQEAGCSSLAR